MVDTLYPANLVGAAPSYSGRKLRQTLAAGLGGATAARPLGARSGVRPGTPASTVTASTSTWSCGPLAGVADVMTAAESGPYEFAFDAATTGAMTPQGGTARTDALYVQITDPEDGTTPPTAARIYLAGPGGTGNLPTTPARSFRLCRINVPATGGGSPTVTWDPPYAVAAGGVLPIDTLANLRLITTFPEGARAEVCDDPVASNNIGFEFNGSAWIPTRPTTLVVGAPNINGTTTVTAPGPEVPLIHKLSFHNQNIAANGTMTFTFPTPFPNGVLMINPVTQRGVGVNPVINDGQMNKTGATLFFSGVSSVTTVWIMIESWGW